jgi:hypothetical protein
VTGRADAEGRRYVGPEPDSWRRRRGGPGAGAWCRRRGGPGAGAGRRLERCHRRRWPSGTEVAQHRCRERSRVPRVRRRGGRRQARPCRRRCRACRARGGRVAGAGGEAGRGVGCQGRSDRGGPEGRAGERVSAGQPGTAPRHCPPNRGNPRRQCHGGQDRPQVAANCAQRLPEGRERRGHRAPLRPPGQHGVGMAQRRPGEGAPTEVVQPADEHR